ncbi:peptidoglycan recognition protein family protein [Phytohabitans suffuscus]|uniref:N-acetylmuramoyl-L-alanine amidase n=1 Tax=Phytohabitans suffuscus TaxID=624315 RepID=A0A6F8YW33_9ACTN|nr:peptidoglycan-binding protein [Phytohabitans suffuscus]BCB90370.1 N-acetylmuramoyl-L-alanine amidase [Phytohabitans suffuscus]
MTLDRRTLIKTGVGAAAAGGLTLPGVAAAAPSTVDAAPPQPFVDTIVTGTSWAARPPSGTPVLNTGTTQKVVIHHTAYPNSTDYSVNQAIWLARDIQNLHMDGNGWLDSGQHFTVSRGGFVLEGRAGSLAALRGGTQQVVGAHSPGENGRAIGIENEGIYVEEAPPRPMLAGLTALCVEICRRYGLGAHVLFGHWDFRETQCPGIEFYKLFPKVRRDVARALGQRPSAVPARTWPNILSPSTGPVVRLAQYLLRTHGYAVQPTGTFDPGTVAAVNDFQVRNGMPAAGLGEVLGGTWDALVPALGNRSTGDAVLGLQSVLLPKGYPVELTGAFDTATRDAVRQVQRLHGLAATGRVDLATWCAVAGGIVRQEFER